MNPGFTILTNRKRALIALVHSVAFLLLASRDLALQTRLSGVLGHLRVPTGSAILLAIYLIVTSILLYLFTRSTRLPEKLYFAFCAASAGSGVVRALIGDAAFPSGQYLRVAMLLAAVATGLILLRTHTGPVPHPSRKLPDQLSFEND